MRPIAAIAAAFLAIVICAGPSVQAQDSTSRLNAGVLLYSQQNFETARDVFAAIDTPAGRVWLARTQLQLQQYRLAIETATAARAAGLPPEQDAVAERIQIAALRLGNLAADYPDLARQHGIEAPRDYGITAGLGLDYVTGLLKEFDVNGAAVREGDLRVTLTGAGTYRLPWRPAEFEPVAGYRFTHRMFFENDGFNQQNHQPFLSLSRRIGEDLSLSVRYDHTTSLSGNGLDLFVRQHGGSVTGLYRLASGDLLRGGYSLIWSNFNNVDDDDNLTNAVAMSWTRPDAGAPENAFTLGGRLALVSAEAQSSAHSAISIFAARETEIDGWFTLTAQVLAGRAQFNDDDPVDNIRRKDTTFSGSVVARRELGHNLFLNGNLSVTRVISTIDRIDRTSAVIGAGLRLNF